MPRALIVVGKAPAAGSTKTRLVPPLSAQDAADLYRGFLLDTLELAASLGWERTSVVHPRGDGPALAALLREMSELPQELDTQTHSAGGVGRRQAQVSRVDDIPFGSEGWLSSERASGDTHVRLLEQSANGLGDALAYAFERHFAAGFDTAILIGSDNPTLSVEPVKHAHAALQGGADLAIGPTVDGGYYLIGMRQLHLGVFEDINWSTPLVYAETLDRARSLGLRVHSVAEWYDVDEPGDLDRLSRELAEGPATLARHTRLVLERLSPIIESAPAVSGSRPTVQRTRV
jgi:glycosyltransferase A (GT-A) superfamily protein (DUF2064 family)